MVIVALSEGCVVLVIKRASFLIRTDGPLRCVVRLFMVVSRHARGGDVLVSEAAAEHCVRTTVSSIKMSKLKF